MAALRDSIEMSFPRLIPRPFLLLLSLLPPPPLSSRLVQSVVQLHPRGSQIDQTHSCPQTAPIQIISFRQPPVPTPSSSACSQIQASSRVPRCPRRLHHQRRLRRGRHHRRQGLHRSITMSPELPGCVSIRSLLMAPVRESGCSRTARICPPGLCSRRRTRGI